MTYTHRPLLSAYLQSKYRVAFMDLLVIVDPQHVNTGCQPKGVNGLRNDWKKNPVPKTKQSRSCPEDKIGAQRNRHRRRRHRSVIPHHHAPTQFPAWLV